MAIKTSRPGFEDDVVVYVAKSVDEVDKLRAGLEAAGITVDLPESAVEAMFASGQKTLAVRVSAADFQKAIDVVDEVFPRPEVVLPPLEDEEPPAADGEAGEDSAAPEADKGDGPSKPQRTGPELERADVLVPRKASRLPSAKKLEGAVLKLIVINAGSFLFPIIGILFAGFGLYAGIWCLQRYDEVPGVDPKVRSRSIVAIVLASLSLLWNIGVGIYLAWRGGWF